MLLPRSHATALLGHCIAFLSSTRQQIYTLAVAGTRIGYLSSAKDRKVHFKPSSCCFGLPTIFRWTSLLTLIKGSETTAPKRMWPANDTMKDLLCNGHKYSINVLSKMVYFVNTRFNLYGLPKLAVITFVATSMHSVTGNVLQWWGNVPMDTLCDTSKQH